LFETARKKKAASGDEFDDLTSDKTSNTDPQGDADDSDNLSPKTD
jgi:hypothetical protein